jgi:hypothetical protein
MRRSLVYVFVAGILMVSAAAMAADLYSMDMELCLPAPDSYPVSIQIDMHKGKEPANLKGTTSADFDGTVLSNIACDALMCITGATESDGMLCITYESIGYKEGKYEADTYFEAFVGDVQTGLHMHTSCSQDIFLDHPYGGLPFPSANFLVREADGTCDIYDRQGCVPNPYKIQWLFVRFEVPCTTVPADLHLTLFKDSSDYRGESVAHFDGTELSGVFSRGKDDKHPATAILHDAQIVGDEMFVWFYVYGHKGNGEMESASRFQLEVEGCGTFYMDIHTSCSQEIWLGLPGYELMPEGYGELENACAACANYVPVEDATWGTIKALYR